MSREPPAKHTLGPWIAERDDDQEQYCIGHRHIQIGQRVVATVSFGLDEPAESEQHANARLIAAAPDMLEALKLAMKWLGNCTPVVTIEGPKPLPAIYAALLKAGVQP